MLLGVAAILVALPLLLAGVTLWAVMQHRAADGWFTASLAPIPSPGYAVVVPDVDTLLRHEAPFVRGGQTTLRFTARTGTGPAFIGLAPRAAVQRYLTGVRHDDVTRIRLARGGLPAAVSPVSGSSTPTAPPGQSFWVVSSGSGTLFWSPSDLRGEQLSLVVMNPTGAATDQVQATAAMLPRWLDPTTYGLLILGTVAFLIGMVLLFWPRRYREIVYVVEPSQVPEIAARLGISTEPLAAALGAPREPLSVFGDPEPADPDPGDPEPDLLVEPPAWLVEPDGVEAPAAPVSPAVGAPPAAEPAWAAPTPVPAGQPGIYRSTGAPPPITPSFVWPPMPD